MINEVMTEAEARMKKSMVALAASLNKIRTGRAHPSILDGIMVDYYGSKTPLGQVASVSVEDSRTLSLSPWEKDLVPALEKAIMSSGLGLNPATAGMVIRIPMPALTEETRKVFIKQAKAEAETGRVSVRNVRRDANEQLKDFLKEKEISEDEERKGMDDIQKLTDKFVADIEKILQAKEKDLLEI